MRMNRNFLWILTSILVLIPSIVGLCLWNSLPEQIPTHFDMSGTVDGWSSRGFAVFGIPLMMLAMHWICLLVTRADPKSQNIPEKVFSLIAWICPVVSLFVGALMFSSVLELSLNAARMGNLLLAVLFLVIGNYLPKCQPNYTVGIKLPWTLNDDENWRRTHRFAGYVWMIGGAALLPAVFISAAWIPLAIALVIAILPAVYSYILYVRSR